MIGIIGFLGILFLLFLDFQVVRKLSSPLCLAGGIWMMQYITLFMSLPFSFFNDTRVIVFFFCFACFFVGFKFFTANVSDECFCERQGYVWNPGGRVALLVSMYAFSVIIVIKCWKILFTSTSSIWMMMNRYADEENLFSGGLENFFLNAIPIVFLVCFAMFLYNPIRENRINLYFMAIPLLVALVFSPRGGWFFLMISMAYIYVFIKNVSNKRILFSSLILLCLVFVIWGYSSLDKFSLSYAYMNDFEKIQYLFSGYFVNPALNLFYLFDSLNDFGNGTYTFRFFCAILAKFFPEIEVVDTISPFLYINGSWSNVYTAVGWLYRDFGLFWVYMVFVVLGLFYGYLYKRMLQTKTIFFVVFSAIMMMPIAYFFFDDVLFSRLSIWLQRLIFIVFLTSPAMLSKRK